MKFSLILFVGVSLLGAQLYADPGFDPGGYAAGLLDDANKKLSQHDSCECKVEPISFCQAVSAYPRKNLGVNQLEAFGGSPSGICDRIQDAATRKTAGSNPFHKEQLDTCRPSEAKSNQSSAIFKAPTVAEMAARGYELAKPDEVKAFLKEAEDTRDRFASICCGSDETCIKAMKRVEITRCTSDAETHRDVPDSCSKGSRVDFTDFETALLYNKFLDRDKELSDSSRAEEVEKDKYTTANLFTKWQNLSLKEKYHERFQFPFAGRVILSTYKRTGSTNDWLDAGIVHELSHSCSSIKRQEALNITKDRNLLFAEASSFFSGDRASYCNEAAQQKAYKDLYYQYMDGDSGTLTQCIGSLGLVAKLGSPTRPQCADACPASYLEESFVELVSWKNSKFEEVEHRACFGERDSLHALNQDVLECAIQNSPSFRKGVLEGHGCKQ